MYGYQPNQPDLSLKAFKQFKQFMQLKQFNHLRNSVKTVLPRLVIVKRSFSCFIFRCNQWNGPKWPWQRTNSGFGHWLIAPTRQCFANCGTKLAIQVQSGWGAQSSTILQIGYHLPIDQLPLLEFLPPQTIAQAEFRKSNSFRIWYFPLNCPNKSYNIAKYEDFSFNYKYTRSKSRCYFTLKDAYLPHCSLFEINFFNTQKFWFGNKTESSYWTQSFCGFCDKM